MAGTNALAYFANEKSFMSFPFYFRNYSNCVVNNEQFSKDSNTQPGANVIKLFTAVSYDFLKYAISFVPGKPFQVRLNLQVRLEPT